MKPEDIEYQLSQLLDGELPAEQAQALRRRLAEDPALAEEYRRYQALEKGLGGMGRQTPSVDWELQRDSIRAVLEREALLKPLSAPWRSVVFRWSAAVSAAAACVVAGLLVLNWFVSGGPGRGQAAISVDFTIPKAHAGSALQVAMTASAAPAASGSILAVEYEEHSAGEQATAPAELSGGAWAWAERPGTVIVSAGVANPSQAQGTGFWGLDEL
jgi:anti-sigma factor RsiW